MSKKPTAVAHSARAHAKFSASSAWIWAGYPGEPGCPASVVISAKLPKEAAGEAAAEGTKAHEHLELALKQSASTQAVTALTDWTLGADAQMLAAVRLTLGYIDDLKAMYPNLQVFSEIEILFMEDVGGTFDLLCYDPDTGQMWVIDFKYGRVPVRPDNNPQLLSYAVFARREFKFPAWAYNLVIIQPRDFSLSAGESPIKEWLCQPADVSAWEDQIVRAVEEAKQNPPVYRPRPDRCRRCRGAAICEAIAPEVPTLPVAMVTPKAPRKKRGEEKQPAPPPFFVEKKEDGVDQKTEPQKLSPSALQQIGAALDGLPALEAYVEATRKLGEELAISHGIEIPGWKTVYKGARASWDADDVTVANALWRIARISPSQSLPTSLISITEAKELINGYIATLPAVQGEEAADARAKEIEAVWDDFTRLTKRLPSGKLDLVPLGDKRPPASLVDLDRELTASAVFDSVEGAEEVGGERRRAG